ncbi:MAG: sugar ABC transporter ATP-binding protein [Verrucomicrobiales bacterium]|nr:sugar ABC transporter ATP-binding protein [Verrucomicrobiales bacterium]
MPDAAPPPPVLQARRLSKSFPGVQALDGVDLDVFPGEVHALMGENGAGKSTLMKVLAGLCAPDSGTLRFAGREVTIPNPHAAAQLGIGMIHQELMAFPDLTVAENLLMGAEPIARFPGWVDRTRLKSAAAGALGRLGTRLDPGARMGDLTVAQMQTVEIARALARAARVLIMDEPTSALSDHEAEALFRAISELRGQGLAILYISHRMAEVFRLADRVTVLRDGRVAGTDPIARVNEAALIRLMVGRELPGARPRSGCGGGQEVLRVNGLTRLPAFAGVGFTLRRGEVLGLAGLMGAGRTQVLDAIAGLVPAGSGEIHLLGRPVRIRRPADAQRHGIALVTEDRRASGLVPRMSVAANLTLASLRRCCRAGIISARREAAVAEEQIARFRIRTADRHQPVEGLSGGNQQKVVLAKALLTRPRILLLDEPTRGIDVAAKAEVHELITRLAGEGLAILLVSSELPELLRLCDRLLVLREGTVSGELNPRDASPEEILRLAMPVDPDSAPTPSP